MVNFWPYTFDYNAVTYLFVYLSLSKNVTQEICVHPTIGNFLGYITAFRLGKKLKTFLWRNKSWQIFHFNLVLRRARVGADALRHAGNRRWRLAEKHHIPALHQELETNPVVLAGKSPNKNTSTERDNILCAFSLLLEFHQTFDLN